MSRILKLKDNEKIFIVIYTILSLCLFYIFLATLINKNIFYTTSTAYYNFLLEAIFHGHIFVSPHSHYDLSLFHGKWYLNWGPAPLLFILPFYLIMGVKASDIFYTLLAGVLNIVLFYAVLLECKKYFRKNVSLFSEIFILVSFTIASPNFVLSFIGQIWGTEQIIGTMFLLISYLFYFKFLQSKNLYSFVASALFFNLAWLSRYTLLFSGIIFLFPFLIFQNNKKLQKQILLLFAGITCVFFIIFFTYNYAKFQNPFETGLRYHNGNKRYSTAMQSHTFFSPKYFFHNFYYYFLNVPKFSLHVPIVSVDREGNSMFFIYPGLVLLFFLYKKKQREEKKINIFIFLVGIVIFFTLSFFLLYFATGWTQFGIRYFLDIAPLSYLLLIFVLEDVPLCITIPLLLYEVCVNILGTLSFFFQR